MVVKVARVAESGAAMPSAAATVSAVAGRLHISFEASGKTLKIPPDAMTKLPKWSSNKKSFSFSCTLDAENAQIKLSSQSKKELEDALKIIEEVLREKKYRADHGSPSSAFKRPTASGRASAEPLEKHLALHAATTLDSNSISLPGLSRDHGRKTQEAKNQEESNGSSQSFLRIIPKRIRIPSSTKTPIEVIDLEPRMSVSPMKKQGHDPWLSPFREPERTPSPAIHISDFKATGTFDCRSMTNIGNSCYMNSCLQALASSPEFIRCLLDNVPRTRDPLREFSKIVEEETPRRSAVIETLGEIYRHIFSFNEFDETRQGEKIHGQSGAVPIDILENLRRFSGREICAEFARDQHDAQEYLVKLLEHINDTFQGNTPPIVGSPSSDKENKANDSDGKVKDKVKNEEEEPPELKAFAVTCSLEPKPRRNPIDFFKFHYDYRQGCDNCGRLYDPKLELSHEMKLAVREDSSIQSLISNDFGREKLDDSKCETCGKTTKYRVTAMKDPPDCLIIVLKRYDALGKIKCPVKVDRELYMKDFCVGSEKHIRECQPDADSYDNTKNCLIRSPDRQQEAKSENEKKPKSKQRLTTQIGEMKKISPYADLDDDLLRNMTGGGSIDDSDMDIRTLDLSDGDEEMEAAEEEHGEQMEIDGPIQWHVMKAEKIQAIQHIVEFGEMETEDIEEWRERHLWVEPTDLKDLGAPGVVPVKGDGNCLFRSIAYYLFCGKEEHHDIIRQRTVAFIEKCFEHFVECLKSAEITLEDYVSRMKENGTWGTGLELWAMATLFRCCIFVFCQDRWTVFQPKFDYSTVVANGCTCYTKKKSKTNYLDSERLARDGAIFLSNPENRHFSPANTPSEAMKIAGRVKEKTMKTDRQFNFYVPSTLRDDENENSKPSADVQPRSSEPAAAYEYDEHDGPVYTLTAIINHHGTSPNSGHYTCFSFDSERREWLLCDDRRIVPVSEKQVLQQTEREGYIFLYRRRRHGDTKEFSPPAPLKRPIPYY